MYRKKYGVEFQTLANIKLLSARIKTRAMTIERLKGLIATYQEAATRTGNALERFIEEQEVDLHRLQESEYTMGRIREEKEKIIHDITEYRQTRPEDFRVSQSDRGERNAD